MRLRKPINISFQTMVVGMFLPLIILLVALTGFASFHLAEKAQTDTVLENTGNLLHLSCEYFDSRLSSDLAMTIVNLRDSQPVSSITRNINEKGGAMPKDIVALQDYLDTLFSRVYPSIESIEIHFQTQQGDVAYLRSFHQTAPISPDWHTWLLEPEHTVLWHELGSDKLSDGKALAFACYWARVFDVPCFIRISFSEHSVEQAFSHLFSTNQGRIMVVGPCSAFAFDNENHHVEEDSGIVHKIRMSSQQRGSIHSSDLLVIYDTLAITGWKVAISYQTGMIYRGILGMRRVNNAMIIGIILLSIGAALASAWIISRPLKAFSRQVSEIDVRNLGNSTIVKPRVMTAELNSLSDSLENLLERLKMMMEESERHQKHQLQMENRLLLAQINPHFLYNTLYAIAQECNMQETQTASEMLYELAAFFRLGLNSGREIVLLRDEIEHTTNYLKLISRSLSQKLSWKFDVPQGLLDCILPKMTLQPIVENSICHGIRKKESSTGEVTILARQEEDSLLIVITDDGIGMDPSLVALRRQLLIQGDWQKGFGMQNINQRIHSLFGQSFGLEIASTPGIGTSVTIRLPLIHSKEST